MKAWRRFIYELPSWFIVMLTTPLTILQIVLGLLSYRRAGSSVLSYLGWCVWALSGGFGVLPIFALRSRGGVPHGKSYMYTTQLVDTGIYSVVRHPQYLAGALLNLAMIFIAPHWVILALGVVTIGLVYLDAMKADQYCLEKFGAAYEAYMQHVPRLNLLLGIVRLLQRSRDREGD